MQSFDKIKEYKLKNKKRTNTAKTQLITSKLNF